MISVLETEECSKTTYDMFNIIEMYNIHLIIMFSRFYFPFNMHIHTHIYI